MRADRQWLRLSRISRSPNRRRMVNHDLLRLERPVAASARVDPILSVRHHVFPDGMGNVDQLVAEQTRDLDTVLHGTVTVERSVVLEEVAARDALELAWKPGINRSRGAMSYLSNRVS